MSQLSFDHLLNLSFAWHTRRKTGEILRVLDRGAAINHTFEVSACNNVLMPYWNLLALAYSFQHHPNFHRHFCCLDCLHYLLWMAFGCGHFLCNVCLWWVMLLFGIRFNPYFSLYKSPQVSYLPNGALKSGEVWTNAMLYEKIPRFTCICIWLINYPW